MPRPLILRGMTLPDGPLIMAIINRTRDSFYDQGATFAEDAAREAARRAVTDGADILDVGGVRAGQQGEKVSASEEIDRTAGFIAWLAQEFPDVPISIDTWRAEVGDAALVAGAHLINDTWSGAEPELAAVAAKHGAGLVCSHAGGLAPRTDPVDPFYEDVVADVISIVTGLAERALDLGVPREGIIIDPTHDFGKNTHHSLELTRRLDELVATGWPVLVALSNKDFIGDSLDLPVAERLEGSLAAAAISVWHGARVVRTHNVRATRRAVDMVSVIRGDRPPAHPGRSRS